MSKTQKVNLDTVSPKLKDKIEKSIEACEKGLTYEMDFYASKKEGGLFANGPRMSWWKEHIYYPVYRFWRWHKIFHPVEMYYEVKYFIQRGRRGWADQDTWGLDNYLDSWLPDAIDHLNEHTHGYPPELTPEKWSEILKTIAEGFRARQKASDGLYKDELGEYPVYRPEGMTREEWIPIKDAHTNRIEELRKRDMAIFDEGMALFVKYYDHLWD